MNTQTEKAPRMKISEVIKALQAAMDQHGDLPAFTEDSDIAKVEVAACSDGVSRTEDGKAEKPNEFVLIFHPGR